MVEYGLMTATYINMVCVSVLGADDIHMYILQNLPRNWKEKTALAFARRCGYDDMAI